MRNAFSLVLTKVLVLLILLLVSVVGTIAQVSTGTILGQAKDASGAVVSGATITVRNTETNFSRSIMTSEDGSFRFPSLPVGPYEVRAERDGFKTDIHSGLTLSVTQEEVVNFTLEVGATQQTVSVTGEASLVNTTSAALGNTVNEQSVVDLPLNGRSYADLTLLQPGISDNKNENHANRGSVGNYFSSNGAGVRSNNYLLDGASLTNQYGAAPASISNNTLGVDAVREYRVVTSGISAEYGMVMGSQMLVVSKGGTNNFHGTAFEFVRNSVFDARNFFDISSVIGRRLPEFQRNDFGGAFGGPIRKDKTFFFVDYEDLVENKGITTITPDLPSGCSGPAGATITNTQCTQLTVPSVTVASAIAPLLAFYPAPNLSGNRLTFPYAQPTREEFGQIRVDQTFSTKDTLFARATVDNARQEQPTTYPAFTSGLFTRGVWLTVSENHIFSPTVLNTARVSFSRNSLLITADVGAGWQAVTSNPATSFIPPFINGGVSASGFTGAGSPGGPAKKPQNIFAYSDDVFYTRGKHSMKFGALVNRYQEYVLADAGVKGAATFSNITTFLEGYPSQISGIPAGNIVDRSIRYTTMGIYGQDDWRVTSRLTLNLGLRYEIESMPYETHALWAAFIHPTTDPSMVNGVLAMPITRGGRLFNKNPSLLNFGPRIGFAWDVFGDGKTSIRGGADILYDIGNYMSLVLQAELGMPPYTARSVVNYPNNAPGLSNCCTSLAVPMVFPAGSASNGVRPLDYYLGQPRLNLYNLTVERQLPWSTDLSVSYVNSRGYKLIDDADANPTIPQGVPGAGGVCTALPAGQAPNLSSMVDGSATACWVGGDPRINKNWGSFGDYYTSRASSWYNGLQVAVIKRLTKSVQMQASYTYAKSLDTNPGQLNADQSATNSLNAIDPYHLNMDKGRSATDVRHNLKYNAIYYFPKVSSEGLVGKLANGWWASGILTVISGPGFSITEQANRSKSGTSNGGAGLDRPDIAAGRSIYSITHGGSSGCGTGNTRANNGQMIPAGTALGTPTLWFDPCAFQVQTAGFLGNAGRDIIQGPGFGSLDLSIVKDTGIRSLGEEGKLQFRAEFFNLPNRANFALPGANTFAAQASGEAPSATSGVITSTVSSSRQIQLALKLIF